MYGRTHKVWPIERGSEHARCIIDLGNDVDTMNKSSSLLYKFGLWEPKGAEMSEVRGQERHRCERHQCS